MIVDVTLREYETLYYEYVITGMTFPVGGEVRVTVDTNQKRPKYDVACPSCKHEFSVYAGPF